MKAYLDSVIRYQLGPMLITRTIDKDFVELLEQRMYRKSFNIPNYTEKKTIMKMTPRIPLQFRIEDQMEKVVKNLPKDSKFWPNPDYKRATDTYHMGQQVGRDYGVDPGKVRKLWKYDMTDSDGFNALCRIHAYRINRGKIKVDGKSVAIPIECSCGSMFQFRNHWHCQTSKECMTS
jgi:hypothetical protein